MVPAPTGWFCNDCGAAGPTDLPDICPRCFGTDLEEGENDG